jgi:fumarate hydratase class II
MPGKVNPVIPEVVIQVAAQVIGHDTAVTLSGQAGNFELNVMLPTVAYNLIQSIQLLGRAVHALDEKCVRGITANVDQCASGLERSLALATALVPAIGYDRAADLAKEAYRSGKTIREVARASGLLPADEVDRILDRAAGGQRKT